MLNADLPTDLSWGPTLASFHRVVGLLVSLRGTDGRWERTRRTLRPESGSPARPTRTIRIKPSLSGRADGQSALC